METEPYEEWRPPEPTFQEIIIKFRPEIVLLASGAEDTQQEIPPEIEAYFEDKRDLLEQYQAKERPSFDAPRPVLEALHRTAQEYWQKRDNDVPRLDLFWRVRLNEPVDESLLERLISGLGDDDRVEYVVPAAEPGPPPSPNLEVEQKYLEPRSAGGVNACYAWKLGLRGYLVKICVCEYGFNRAHHDLPSIVIISNLDGDLTIEQEHGTQTLGVLAGRNNGAGVTGICSSARIRFASESGNHRTDCLKDVLKAVKQGQLLRAGDVVLLEMQTNSGLPAEYDSDVHAAVKTMVGNHIVVVAAAGNAVPKGRNLNTALAPRGTTITAWKRIWDPTSLDWDDSGAILVGAGNSPGRLSTAHARRWDSAYGSRVNCQGWGDAVVTTGQGDRYAAEGLDDWYTNTYNGTSSASAIIAGVMVCLQGYAKRDLGGYFEPDAMRDLLSDNNNGIPQADVSGNEAATHHVGPLPDLCCLMRAAAEERGISHSHTCA